jgi:pyruvate,orthophosphate dikinase
MHMSTPAVAKSEPKWVYRFGSGGSDGTADMRELLGGKGANLAEMASLGLPVPPGFTLTTEVCTAYYDGGRKLPAGLEGQVERALSEVGRTVGATFGDAANPLLVSVRSGARASMPGMMDTILNLGLNDETVKGLARRSDDARFAYDSYRRFIQMYGDVVLGVDHGVFEDILENHKNLNAYSLDTELGADDWLDVIGEYKAAVERETGKPFPQDTKAQLWGAICAVFGSWHNTRAITYRRLHAIPDDWGTAVNVQAATHPPVRAKSTASSWSTPRARMWWPASARRSLSPRPRAARPARNCLPWKH